MRGTGRNPQEKQRQGLLLLPVLIVVAAAAFTAIGTEQSSEPAHWPRSKPRATAAIRSVPAVVHNAPPPVPSATPVNLATPGPHTDGSAAQARIAAPTVGGGAQTSEYMAGKIVYGVVFVESSGGTGNCLPADEDLETWDRARMDLVLAEIDEGLQFWLNRSGRPSELSFVREEWGTRATSCEPVARNASGPASEEGKWIADVLTALNVTATPADYVGAAAAFAQSRRAALDAHWAFTVFVVDSLNDPDGCFADYDCSAGCDVLHRCLSAHAHLNGPYMVMTWDNGDWGIDNMNGVMAHETGHIFGAGDEYATQPGEPGCSTADTHGYLNVPNTSCTNGPNGNTDDISIMADFDEVTDPRVDVSESARGAIGWRNPQLTESGKVVVDVIKNAEVHITGVPSASAPANPCLFAAASATATVVGGKNSSGRLHSPSNAARIARVEWNVDNGPFAAAIPYDGALDEPNEDYYFAPALPLSLGKHVFGTRAVTDLGAVSPVVYHDVTVALRGIDSFDPEDCRTKASTKPS